MNYAYELNYLNNIRKLITLMGEHRRYAHATEVLTYLNEYAARYLLDACREAQEASDTENQLEYFGTKTFTLHLIHHLFENGILIVTNNDAWAQAIATLAQKDYGVTYDENFLRLKYNEIQNGIQRLDDAIQMDRVNRYDVDDVLNLNQVRAFQQHLRSLGEDDSDESAQSLYSKASTPNANYYETRATLTYEYLLTHELGLPTPVTFDDFITNQDETNGPLWNQLFSSTSTLQPDYSTSSSSTGSLTPEIVRNTSSSSVDYLCESVEGQKDQSSRTSITIPADVIYNAAEHIREQAAEEKKQALAKKIYDFVADQYWPPATSKIVKAGLGDTPKHQTDMEVKGMLDDLISAGYLKYNPIDRGFSITDKRAQETQAESATVLQP